MRFDTLDVIAPGLLEVPCNEAEVLGSAVWLWMHSASHRDVPLHALSALWLPTINYAKTYREVAQSASLALPQTYTCVQPIRIGDAQLASFAYFGHIRFGNPEDNCDILLRHDPYEYGDPSSMPNYEWRVIWEGRRPADRDEHFRMYRLTEAAKATHPAPVPATSRRRKLHVPG